MKVASTKPAGSAPTAPTARGDLAGDWRDAEFESEDLPEIILDKIAEIDSGEKSSLLFVKNP